MQTQIIKTRDDIFSILSCARKHLSGATPADGSAERNRESSSPNQSPKVQGQSDQQQRQAAAAAAEKEEPFSFGEAFDSSKHRGKLVFTEEVGDVDDDNRGAPHVLILNDVPRSGRTSNSNSRNISRVNSTRRNSSTCSAATAMPSAAYLARRRSTATRTREIDALVQKAQRKQCDVLTEEMRVFCSKMDGVLAVAMAGVPTGRDYEDRLLLSQQQENSGSSSSPCERTLDAEAVAEMRSLREQLFFSSMPDGAKPWEVVGGAALLPSYAALHPMSEMRTVTADEVPRELMEYFV